VIPDAAVKNFLNFKFFFTINQLGGLWWRWDMAWKRVGFGER
jgi:hypothetical protein